MEIFKIFKYISEPIFLMIMLSGCSKDMYDLICPDTPIYTKEFQVSLLNDVEKSNSVYIRQAILDLFNIRNQLRICHGEFK